MSFFAVSTSFLAGAISVTRPIALARCAVRLEPVVII